VLAAEAAWLDRLRAAGLGVAVVHPDADGSLGTEVDGRTCVLLDWVEGRSLRTRLSAPAMVALGRLAARLHAETEGHPMPAGIPVADRVLYWRLDPAFPGADLPFRDVFAAALERAEGELAALWRDPPSAPRLLHGDLAPANVVVTAEGELVPIDFQDLVWGLDVQDLSITLTALSRLPDGERLSAAFRRGYAAERPWPELPPATWGALDAARRLHQIALTTSEHPVPELDGYLPERAERMRRYLAG
jgi:Ser/Thr protein kinase RdoA (MazF antagonist)